MINPTGKEIRNDPAGSGVFGAPRGFRPHYGEDFLCEPGQPILAPVSGKITRIVYPYVGETEWTGLEIKSKNLICHLYYLSPLEGIIGNYVKQGVVIGTAQDISKKYGKKCKPHIHFQAWLRPSLFM